MSLESLDSQVKSLIQKNKLSSSSVDSIVKSALANVTKDTELITLLYRHHKKATPSHKLTSLYIIDAIARGTRSQYKKEGKSKAPESTASTTPKDETPAGGGSGTCGTFLKKLEGLLGKIVLDVWENAPVEHREKVRKVLDIWTKAGTFNSTALARLGTKLLASTTSAPSSSGQGKGSPLAPAMSPTGPSLSPAPSQPIPSTSAAIPIPANVLALLQSTQSAEPSEAVKEQKKREEEELMIQRVLAEAQGGPKAFPIDDPIPVPQPSYPSQQTYPPSSFTNPSQIPYNTASAAPPPPPSFTNNNNEIDAGRYHGYQPPSSSFASNMNTNNDYNSQARDYDPYEAHGSQGQASYGSNDRPERGGRQDGGGGGRGGWEDRERNQGFRGNAERDNGRQGERRGSQGGRGARGGYDRDQTRDGGGYRREHENPGERGNLDRRGRNGYVQEQSRGDWESRRHSNSQDYDQPPSKRWEDRNDQRGGDERKRKYQQEAEEEPDYGIAGIDDGEVYRQDDGFYQGGGGDYNDTSNVSAPVSESSRAPLPPDARAPLPERPVSPSSHLAPSQAFEPSSSEPPTKKPFQHTSTPSEPSNPVPYNPVTFSASSPDSWSAFVEVLRSSHPFFVAQKQRGETPSMSDVNSLCMPSAVAMFGWGGMGMGMNPGMGMGMPGMVQGGAMGGMGGTIPSTDNSNGGGGGQESASFVVGQPQDVTYEQGGGAQGYGYGDASTGEQQYYE